MTAIGQRLGRWTYLTFIAVWALPIIVFQWAFAGQDLWARRSLLTVVIAASTTYLAISDAIAIARGIWHINPSRTTGLKIGPLPIEEALFFFVTNVMVAQTIAMVDGPVANRRFVQIAAFLRRYQNL